MTHSDVTANLDAIDGIYKQLNEIALYAAHHGMAIDQVEQKIWGKLTQLGDKLLGLLFAQLGQGDAGPEIQAEGQANAHAKQSAPASSVALHWTNRSDCRARRLRDRYGETRRNFASESGLAA